jgi:hypothetical protein
MPDSDGEEATRAPRKQQQPVKSFTNCLKRTIDRLCLRSLRLTKKYSRAAFQKAYPGRVFHNEMRNIFISWQPSGDKKTRLHDALQSICILVGISVLVRSRESIFVRVTAIMIVYRIVQQFSSALYYVASYPAYASEQML